MPKYLFNKAFIMICLLLIGIILWWLMQTTTITLSPKASKPGNADQIDYYINTFTSRVFKQDGSLHYTLKGEQLKHYRNNDKVIIEEPRLTYQHKDKWTVVSKQAFTGENFDETIVFEDSASMQNDGEAALMITSDRLAFSPDEKRFVADSDKQQNPVYISWKNGNIEGSKMTANLLEETFILENAKATYTTP